MGPRSIGVDLEPQNTDLDGFNSVILTPKSKSEIKSEIRLNPLIAQHRSICESAITDAWSRSIHEEHTESSLMLAARLLPRRQRPAGSGIGLRADGHLLDGGGRRPV